MGEFFATATVFIGLAHSQSNSDCVYRQGPGLELDLSSFKGRELFYSSADDIQYSYTICSNKLKCEHESVSVDAMVEAHRDGINECHYIGIYNETIQPFYDFGIASWIFNYSNGEPCGDQNQQLNTSTTIAFNCQPLAEEPVIVDVLRFDTCNALIQMEWQGACQPAPPPNEECKFKQGFQSLDLSSLKGNTLTYTDENKLAWQFSPCSNKLNCTTSHGYNLEVMSKVSDPTGQCIKFLGVWSGDVIPFYDRTVVGQNYWDFFWADGEECGEGGPIEILNVRYYCNADISGAEIIKAYGNGPCQFRIEIDTNLACGDNEPKMKKTVKRLHKDLGKVLKSKLKDLGPFKKIKV